jgi:hypothetical protein
MQSELTSPEINSPAPPSSRASRLRYHLYRGMLGVWKLIFGVVLTQSLVGSILIVGWVTRAAQRTTQRFWWRKSSRPKDDCFCDFVQCSSFHRALGGWPNWILEHNRAWARARQTPGLGKVRTLGKALFHSLWLNLKLGVQVIFNTWVFTLPAGILMLFAWYAGWHNSFNKGYEQAIVGPITGIGGVILLIAAMYYVPMAQTRQASTGNWRSFYEFKTVWQLIRKRWLSCFGLAVLYTVISVPVTILKTIPAFFTQINPKLAELPATEALDFAKMYYFYAAIVLFIGFLILRIVAAKIYASSLLACIQSGALPEDSLAENEWETLHRLDLLTIKPAAPRHFLVRTAAWLGTKVGRATTGFALFVVWFTFVAQIHASEFFLKSPMGRGWLNQPLIQLPWFNYIPPALKEEAAKQVAE